MITPEDFVPYRLTCAREIRQLSRRELSEEVGIPYGDIVKLERGHLVPSKSHIMTFSRVLRFPVAWFEKEDVHGYSGGWVVCGPSGCEAIPLKKNVSEIRAEALVEYFNGNQQGGE